MSGLSRPFLIVHDIGHVRDAVATAKDLGRPVTLISAPGAAASMGADVFNRMIDAVRAENPDSDIVAVIDCGADPGQAMQALRFGSQNIRLDAPEGVLAKLRDMADGMILDGGPIAAYDMAGDTYDLAAWLEGNTDT